MLEPGDAVPDVTLQMADGSNMKLRDMLGRTLVLYFYPKDDTSGCTKEAQDFSALAAAFEMAGAAILGVSKDGPAAHGKFMEKFGLKVALATDADGSVTEGFGTWIEKSMYGRKYMGIDRATFLIDKAGRIVRVWRKVKVPGHADEVLAAASSLSSGGSGRARRGHGLNGSVAAAARAVLTTADPAAKLMAARAAARDWRLGRLDHAFDVAMPDRPARPAAPLLLAPSQMPKRGRAGNERSRIAMLHALAHIEFVAIDLAFDLIGRFGGGFPRGFVDDWMRVGAEEAMHFAILGRRLRALGSGYGALPAHDGLWQAAEATAHDPLARLAVVPMVLEARGLDVTPATIARFREAGDAASARLLARILNDEVRHVACGVRWFAAACAARRFAPAETWRKLVGQYFRGSVKPPFNDSARESAA